MNDLIADSEDRRLGETEDALCSTAFLADTKRVYNRRSTSSWAVSRPPGPASPRYR